MLSELLTVRQSSIRQTVWGLVTRVVDGDTLVVTTRLQNDVQPQSYSVRLACVDAPEMRARTSAERSAALASRQLLSVLTLGVFVRLQVECRDKYGRLLAMVYLPLQECDGSVWCQRVVDAILGVRSGQPLDDQEQVPLPEGDWVDCRTTADFLRGVRERRLSPLVGVSRLLEDPPEGGVSVCRLMVDLGAATEYDGGTKVEWSTWQRTRNLALTRSFDPNPEPEADW